MMPQDFPSPGFEQAAGLGAVQAFDTRTATALACLEREIRELRQLWAGAEALTLELRASGHHDTRPLLASARHRRPHA